jgi:Domain of unknown function (DUF1963)
MQELLTVMGLPHEAEHLAHEVAATGLLLEPAHGTRSRLGGPPLLPAGEPWPATADGVPLSFLAAIELSELPPDGPLPPAGWLLFFAALDPDDGGLIDEAGKRAGVARARARGAGGERPGGGGRAAPAHPASSPGPPARGLTLPDMGTIQFRIPAPALAARDWSQVTALADSG